MQKFDVTIRMEKVAEARAKWTASKREFDEAVNKVMGRLLNEAAVAFMSVDEVSKASGLSKLQVRNLMRANGLDPRDGKALLAKSAAKALDENAALLGIDPVDMDLTSPLAYLPMGDALRRELQSEATRQGVKEIPDECACPRMATGAYRVIPGCWLHDPQGVREFPETDVDLRESLIEMLERREIITTNPDHAATCCGMARDSDGFCQNRNYHSIYVDVQ